MDLNQQKSKKRGLLRNKIFWASLVMVGLVLGGVSWIYTKGFAFQAQATETVPSYYTTTVRQGDLRKSTSGSGKLVAASEASLSFATSGTVGTLNVTVGDLVNTGQVLAQLKDLDGLKASVSSAKLALLEAQSDLDALNTNADVALATAHKAYIDAQQTYADALETQTRTAYARCSKEVTTNLVVRTERAAEQLAKSYHGSEEWIALKSQYDTNLANLNYCKAHTEDEITSADSTLQVAETQLKLAEELYNTLQASSGIDPNEQALLKNTLEDCQYNLADAEKNLESATLISPMAGTVISIAAGQCEQVDTSTFITIADLNEMNVEVQVDEADLAMLAVGNQVEVIFDALPDRTFTGTVIQVDPTLSSSGPYQVVKGLVELDGIGDAKLILGLNASVEIIQSEVKSALLVPKEAVRDLGDGQYSVFILQNGQLIMKVVEVGLMDDTFAEIRSGLELGDVVSTGIVESIN